MNGDGVRHGLAMVDLAVARIEQRRADDQLRVAEQRAADASSRLTALDALVIELEAKSWDPAIAGLRYGQRVRVTETLGEGRVITGQVDYNRPDDRFVYVRSDDGGRGGVLQKRGSGYQVVELLDDVHTETSRVR